jgi:hypothetical protein
VLWVLFTVLMGLFIVGLQVLCIAELMVMVSGEDEGMEKTSVLGREKALGEQRVAYEGERRLQ